MEIQGKGKGHPMITAVLSVLMTSSPGRTRHRAAAVTGSGEIPFDGSCKDMRSPGP